MVDGDGREQIFNLIEKHRIPGVLLTSGDRHGARVFTVPRPSGYKFYEFEPASLGGRGDGPPNLVWTCDALVGFHNEHIFSTGFWHNFQVNQSSVAYAPFDYSLVRGV